MEEMVCFESGQQRPLSIYGVLSRPETEHSPRTAVVLLAGWSGTRVGPHGLLVAACRDLAAAGFYALRFDYRGRGDSFGDQDSAHIGTMAEDAVAVSRILQKQYGVERVILGGICAGAMVAMAAAPKIENLAGLALWSPEPFHPNPLPHSTTIGTGPAPATSAQHSHKAGSRKLALLKSYAKKISDPRTWEKLRHGQLQPRIILRILMGRPDRNRVVTRHSEDDWAGPKPDERLYEEALPHLEIPVLFVYGSNDPICEESQAYYRALRRGRDQSTQFYTIAGANHSFYALTWKAEAIRRTREWIQGI